MTQSKYKPPVTRWSNAEEDMAYEFHQWGVVEYDVNRNVMGSQANSATLSQQQRAVTVVFKKDGRTVELSTDLYDTPAANLKAIQLCVRDMRMIERRGASQLMAQAFLQLEGPQGPTTRDPYEVLQARPDADRATVDALYRVRANVTHPDKDGGSAEAFQEVAAAKERIYLERGWA